MKKSIFTGRRESFGGIRIDPFFTELAVIIPVFAMCCCAVLQMLSAASKRAETERLRADAVSLSQSYCEIYSVCGSAEEAAEEVFGKDIPKMLLSKSEFAVPLDSDGKYTAEAPVMTALITESSEDTRKGSLVYGQLMISEIHIVFGGEDFGCDAAYYKPFPAIIYAETEDISDE